MTPVVLFNKPFRVISQFRESGSKVTLSSFFNDPDLRVAGRLDYDSEGLLLLSDDGQLVQKITNPRFKLQKTYWAQVEGQLTEEALEKLRKGVELKDGRTLPANARLMAEPANLWRRDPPIRFRESIPTSWLELTITEGRNRQVRRMTAAVNLPTLRLIRVSIGDWSLDKLQPGDWLAI